MKSVVLKRLMSLQKWECSLFSPWFSYFLGLWKPVGEKKNSFYFVKTTNGDADFNEPTLPNLCFSFLRVIRGWKEHGGDGIFSKFHTFARFVDIPLLEMINAQHWESRRGPVL